MSSVVRFSALMALVACNPEPEKEPVVAPLEPVEDVEDEPVAAIGCEAGGDPILELGTGGLSGFTPFADGGTIALDLDGSGTWGLYVDLLTTGLDTSEPVTALLRYTVGDASTTQDAGARLALQCPNGGPGWAGVFAPLDDELQDDLLILDLEDQPLHLVGLLTDRTGATVSTELDLRIVIP